LGEIIMSRMRLSRSRSAARVLAGTSIAGLCVAAWPGGAFAYRPFDGTDAAVADKGELEIEFQPAGVRRDDTQKTLVAPATVINYGFKENWELVLESQLETPLSPSGPSVLTASGAFLKHVLREGVLQDKAGPSIATEFGLLLPDSAVSNRLGASFAGIVSQRFTWGTIHLNGEAALTRDHNADVFLGAIIEGPITWKVRPVAEFFVEDEVNVARTVSALVGAIWQVNDKLSFDIGFREALTGGRPVSEIRAGFTVGFDLAHLVGAGRK
jgi:hypothetical protein